MWLFTRDRTWQVLWASCSPKSTVQQCPPSLMQIALSTMLGNITLSPFVFNPYLYIKWDSFPSQMPRLRQRPNLNHSCPISPPLWGTKKIHLIVTSALSAETSALATTLDQLTWIRICWAWLLNPKTNWRKPKEISNLPDACLVWPHGQLFLIVRSPEHSCLPDRSVIR